MLILITGLTLFFSIHALPSLALKQSLVSRLGANAYKGLFSLAAIIGLGLIIYGKSQAEFIAIWQPPAATRWLPMLLMWPALILLSWAEIPGNIKQRLRHPMLLGIMLFSAAHLSANGDLASILLFASFGLFALLDFVAINRRQAPAPIVKKPLVWDIAGVVIGTLLYGLIGYFHQPLMGVTIF